jgi:hypothetical protein
MGQELLADAFAKSWKGASFTRIEMNSKAEVPGATPPDNNNLESFNGKHKIWMVRWSMSSPTAQIYIGDLAKWVESCSIRDTEFGEFLNTDVHSNLFYAAVQRMIEAPISPLTVTYPQSPRSDGIVIIASQFTLNELLENDKKIEETPRALKTAAGGWHKEYKDFVSGKKPLTGLSFDQLTGVQKSLGKAGWSRAFYYLTPITLKVYLENLYGRLHDSGLEMIAFEEVEALGVCGLMSCSCSKFLHRAWCIHACVDAFKKNIITGFPGNMDPTDLKPKVGRRTWKVVRGLEKHELCGETK